MYIVHLICLPLMSINIGGKQQYFTFTIKKAKSHLQQAGENKCELGVSGE